MRLESVPMLYLLITLISCAPVTQKAEKEDVLFVPIAASLCFINQKVDSHFLVSGIPDSFNEVQYKAAVQNVCYPIPACKSQAQEIFDNYAVSVRKMDDTFTVMLCDKQMKKKIMEDFGCNNTRVEVRSWKLKDNVPCEFEADWSRIKREYCGN